jgi:hypothetical protein
MLKRGVKDSSGSGGCFPWQVKNAKLRFQLDVWQHAFTISPSDSGPFRYVCVFPVPMHRAKRQVVVCDQRATSFFFFSPSVNLYLS